MRSAARNPRGFTLLELLIVGMLGVLVITIITNASKWYGRSQAEIQKLTMLNRELKIAAQAIAQDDGAALATRSLDGNSVQFDIDGGALNDAADWDAPDTIIEYSLDSGKLLRRDVLASTQVPIATHISTLTASTVSGKLQLHLVAATGDVDQDITLVLQGP